VKPTREQINEAFERVDAVLIPLTLGDGGNSRGEGGDPGVVAARAAMQGLYLLRQWARMSVAPAASPPPPPPPVKTRPGAKRRKP
jgi:hypothetical protein